MLKVLKIVKEILIVVSIWSLFMLFVFGALQFDSVLLSLAMFGFLVFYRVQKNKNMDYLKPFRKFFWIGMFLLMIAAFAFSPATPKKTPEKQEVEVKTVKKEEPKEVSKPKDIQKEKPKEKSKPVKLVEKEKKKEKPETKIKEKQKPKPKPKQKPKKELKNQTASRDLSDEDFMRLALELDSENAKLTELFHQVYEDNPDIVNQSTWRKQVLGHVLKLEKNLNIIKSSDIYKERILKNNNGRNSFKQLELNAQSARLMYESFVEKNSKKMERAVHIQLIEIPAVENK